MMDVVGYVAHRVPPSEDIQVVWNDSRHNHTCGRLRGMDLKIWELAGLGEVEYLRRLVDTGVNVNEKGSLGRTALHWAAAEGHAECVRLLLKAGAEVNTENNNGQTPLHETASLEQPECLRLLLEAGAEVNVEDRREDTPLHLAADRGSAECARLLLEAGGHKNAISQDTHTPLHNAARNGHAECVRVLLEAGANVNAKTKSGDTPLESAIFHGDNADSVRLLLEAGADADRDNGGPVRLAASSGRAECLNTLLRAGGNANGGNSDGDTALHCAADFNRVEAVRVLLEWGADPSIRNRRGKLPIDKTRSEEIKSILRPSSRQLVKAVQAGNSADARRLVSAGVDVNEKGQNGTTALHWAAKIGRVECVGILIEAGGKLDAVDYDGCSPLHMAATNGREECIRILLEAGAKINEIARSGWTPLHGAIQKGQWNCARLLLEAGAIVNTKDVRGMTPLHMVAMNGRGKWVSALLEAGANVNVVGGNGSTPLHGAVENGQLECVRILLEAGGSVHVVDGSGDTPLHLAVEKREADCVRLLLEAGANVDAVARNCRTCLHRAAFNGDAKCVDALLKAGGHVNVEDEWGETPLHDAATNGDAECVCALLAAGGNLNAVSRSGNTPLHAAAYKNRLKAVRALLEAGADPSIRNKEGLLWGKRPIDVTGSEQIKALLRHTPHPKSHVPPPKPRKPHVPPPKPRKPHVPPPKPRKPQAPKPRKPLPPPPLPPPPAPSDPSKPASGAILVRVVEHVESLSSEIPRFILGLKHLAAEHAEKVPLLNGLTIGIEGAFYNAGLQTTLAALTGARKELETAMEHEADASTVRLLAEKVCHWCDELHQSCERFGAQMAALRDVVETCIREIDDLRKDADASSKWKMIRHGAVAVGHVAWGVASVFVGGVLVPVTGAFSLAIPTVGAPAAARGAFNAAREGYRVWTSKAEAMATFDKIERDLITELSTIGTISTSISDLLLSIQELHRAVSQEVDEYAAAHHRRHPGAAMGGGGSA